LKKTIWKAGFLALVSLLIGVCANPREKNKDTTPKPIEIKEYQGKKLSSINDFRENSIKGPQHIDKESYRLKISGLVDNPRTYTYNDIINLQSYQKVVTLNCVEGWDVTILWEGILVKDLIKEAGIDPKAKIVIFNSHEGYSTSFPLDYVMKNDIIMAYKMNGLTLPPERGFPFQLVAENKWGYKWIKWITQIELSDNENYRGYWESRGYSNDGDLDKSFFD
jgi:DMSO/TMAO reductase YedYZ molybdopterin-dependent catalytic subunit